MAAVSIPSTFASFTETWSPRLVAAVNDQHVKIAKIDGEFIFHAHPDSDELFYLLSGELTLEIEARAQGDGEAKPKSVEAVTMKVGDVYVVPKGVRHRPVAKNAEILMIERNDTVNTGDAEDQQRQKDPLDVRGQ
ncbi:RmlC-like cupin domain-containing protein [Xylaria sp. FL0933]|nr:RmlC-like cupin domain-containing protein [Xylaria sp. FL0933]